MDKLKINIENLVKRNFKIDGIPHIIEGYEQKNSKGWNGWATPLFTLEALKKVSEIMEEEGNTFELIFWSNNKVFFRDAQTEETYEIYQIESDGLLLYESSFGWTWEIA